MSHKTEEGSVTGDEDDGKLRRNVGFISGTALIVGSMIGSGIFVSPRGVLMGAGSVGLSFIIWVACGLLSMLGALSYTELGTAIPLSGGEHSYLMFTFSHYGRFWGAVPAYMFDWVSIFVLRPSMVGIMCLSLATYATQPFYSGCIAPTSVTKLIALVAIALITYINCASVKAATKVQTILTLSKLIAVAVISLGGIIIIALGSTEYISAGFEDTTHSPSLVAMAFYNGLWAYDGWNTLNFATEELKNVHRDLPRSIIVGIPLTTACYVLTNIGYLSVLSKEDILWSDAVAVLWGERVLGAGAWVIPVFVVLSCFGAANGSLFSTGRFVVIANNTYTVTCNIRNTILRDSGIISQGFPLVVIRLCFAAAREGHMPRVLSFIHTRYRTPSPAIIFTATLSMLYVISMGNLGAMIGFFSFTAWIFYGLTSLSLIILRYSLPDLHRPYKVPVAVPWIVFIASIYLVIAPIAQDPRIEFLYAFLFFIAGFIFYVPFVYMKISFGFVGKCTRCLQKLLEIAP